jgi:hypothetical protein
MVRWEGSPVPLKKLTEAHTLHAQHARETGTRTYSWWSKSATMEARRSGASA